MQLQPDLERVHFEPAGPYIVGQHAYTTERQRP
jgi:hypothetical protein